MASRLNLQTDLENLLGSEENVYFQPPESFEMNYPAITYTRNQIKNSFADNSVYKQSYVYTVTVIDEDPDSEIVTKVSKLPMCRFDRHFSTNGLNHDVFILEY